MFNSLSLKVILFGFIFTFFSSFGQSFFLGLFNSSIRDALSITHGQFGTIYASATLLSSLVIIWVGKKIDDIDVFKFGTFVTLLLSFSCYFFSKVSSVTFLFIAIFLMRFSGQGLMSHTATTTISRYFTKSRGKALSTGWFGLSTAEFILPVFIIYLLTFIQFYIVCANMLAMPWIATGIFVYQSFILSSKNWGPYVIAQSFMAYSVLSVITLFIAGFLIDKFSSRKLLIYMNLPFLLSLFLIIVFDNSVVSFLFLGLIGISNGLANVLGSSTWAEVYGVKHIGSIKALTTALMVFSTAFGTAVFGLLIDKGFSIEQISMISGTYIFLALIALFFVRNKLNPIKI